MSHSCVQEVNRKSDYSVLIHMLHGELGHFYGWIQKCEESLLSIEYEALSNFDRKVFLLFLYFQKIILMTKLTTVPQQ